MGQHPLVTRLLKGIFHDRPPLPRYSGTWNVQNVLNYLEGLGENKSFPLKLLSWKLTMLLALTRPSRSDIRTNQKEYVFILILLPSSLDKALKKLISFFFPPRQSLFMPSYISQG